MCIIIIITQLLSIHYFELLVYEDHSDFFT